MIIMWLAELAATLTEAFIGVDMIGCILNAEKANRRRKAAVILIVSCAVIGINQYKLFSWIATTAEICILTLGGMWIYRKKASDVLVATGVFIFLLYFCDFVITGVIGVLSGNPLFGAELIQGYSWKRVFYLAVYKGTESVLYWYVFKRYMNRIVTGNRKALVGVFLAVVLEYYMSKTVLSRIETESLALGLMLGSVFLVALYIVSQCAHMQKLNMEIKEIAERNALLMQGYRELLSNEKYLGRYYHDLKAHFLILKSLVLEKKYEHARQYAELLEENSGAAEPVPSRTGIPELDIILNVKLELAKEEGAEINMDVELLDIQHIALDDLCSVLGNLLDNAVEAVKEVEKDRRRISVCIKYVQKMLLFKIENTSQEKSIEGKHILKTTKEDTRIHGWGMQSVQMVADKYGGTFDIECEDGVFRVSVMFFE